VVVALCGELDYANAADAGAAIIAVMTRGQSLIVDMSALDFIDCSSLSILQRLARQAGGDMVLAAPQRHARRLLILTGKDHTFCIHPSVQAAVASLGSPSVRGTLSGLR
jgi:anti-anti-sigma factor